ncbi:MAG: HD domain-containing phosphohydrolase [Acidobacteriota bacterium]|nr:HD domain-containing phosphohydrolase [Acidobacteriota bacterium]
MNELTLSRSGRAYVLLVVAVGVFVPLLVLTYASSKLSTARVEEANKHLAELSHLYLSTIEALALTIDAKDQVTSGHIRRVQIHSVAVARRLGVSDDKQVKAIEASALLHDLGKLAIPEHILNKPGKLTPARNVGRSWLSGGTHRRRDSIGARILSVVDCFDALISDRPYRRAMTKDQAITLIRGRSGSHYDSHIVDTFVGMVDELLTLGPLATAEETAKAAEIRYIVVPSSRTTPMVSPARASRLPSHPALTTTGRSPASGKSLAILNRSSQVRSGCSTCISQPRRVSSSPRCLPPRTSS